MNDLPQHASAARMTRLVREIAGPAIRERRQKGPTHGEKLTVLSVGASLFVITFASLLWIELGPLVANADGPALTSESLLPASTPDPSLPAAGAGLGNDNAAETSLPPTF